MRLIILLSLAVCSCTPQTKYITAECPTPAKIEPLSVSQVNMALPPNEQVRSIIINFQECMNYVEQCNAALKPYQR